MFLVKFVLLFKIKKKLVFMLAKRHREILIEKDPPETLHVVLKPQLIFQ